MVIMKFTHLYENKSKQSRLLLESVILLFILEVGRMEKDKVVELLQYRRHDLVNDMQVIDGYARMNRMDKVLEKLDAFMITIENEQKLHMSAAPSFILWTELFRMKYENFQLSYTVCDQVHLGNYDEWMTSFFDQLVDYIQTYDDQELNIYNIHITIYKNREKKVCVEMTIDHVEEILYERIHSNFAEHEQTQCTFLYYDGQFTCKIQIDGTIEGE